MRSLGAFTHITDLCHLCQNHPNQAEFTVGCALQNT